MVLVSQKSLFPKIVIFADNYPACEEIAEQIYKQTSCACILPHEQLEVSLEQVRQGEIDLLLYASKVIVPGKIKDPLESVVTQGWQLPDAIKKGKKIIFLSAHYISLASDSSKQVSKMAQEIERVSYPHV
jgi:hypothetical protein